MRHALGDCVQVRAILVRTHEEDRVIWKRDTLDPPATGIVVGYRNRHDGRMDSERSEWDGMVHRYYVAKRGFQTVLVATDLRRSHTVALPDDVSPVPHSPHSDTLRKP